MKKMGFLLLIILVLCVSAVSVTAQMSGRWVQCRDPQSGYMVQCFIPDQAHPRVVAVQRPVYAQPVYPQQVYSQPTYGQPSYPPTYEPVYQTQTVRSVQTDYDVGLNQWSGRPYGRYSRRTNKTTITVETNSPNYHPNIRVDAYGNSYSWPRYWSY